MRTFTALHTYLRQGPLPYGVRLISLGLTLINLPPLLLGIVIPFSWPLTIPGGLLWIWYLRMATGGLSHQTAALAWRLTIAFNLILIALTLGQVGLTLWWAAAFQALVIGLSGIALVALRDHEIAPTSNPQDEVARETDLFLANADTHDLEKNLSAGLPVEAWTA